MYMCCILIILKIYLKYIFVYISPHIYFHVSKEQRIFDIKRSVRYYTRVLALVEAYAKLRDVPIIIIINGRLVMRILADKRAMH